MSDDITAAPERIWLCPQNYEAATACGHPSDTEYIRADLCAGVDAEGAARDAELLLARSVAKSASRFCEEVQEDADGVPRSQLRELNNALDAYEGKSLPGGPYDDSQPVLAALQSLAGDVHATDSQRRAATLAFHFICQSGTASSLTDAERIEITRAIAESDIGELTNADIDALVDLFEAWLERRKYCNDSAETSARLAECTGDQTAADPGKWGHIAQIEMRNKKLRTLSAENDRLQGEVDELAQRLGMSADRNGELIMRLKATRAEAIRESRSIVNAVYGCSDHDQPEQCVDCAIRHKALRRLAALLEGESNAK